MRRDRSEPINLKGTPISNYNNAVQARQRGDLPEARRSFKLAADKGHPAATHNLALLTEADDPVRALKLFRDAAFKGVPGAQFALGMRLKDGKNGTTKNIPEAVQHLRRAAEQDHPQANFVLGCMLESGRGMEGGTDIPGALKYLKAAAELGDPRACVNLGHLCEKSAVEEVRTQAAGWYLQASDGGDATASFNLSVLYMAGGGGVAKDEGKGIVFLRLAADRGHGKAQYNLACKLLTGAGGVPRDEEEAVELLEMAAKAGLEKPTRMLRRVRRYLLVRQKRLDDDDTLEIKRPTEECKEAVRAAVRARNEAVREE